MNQDTSAQSTEIHVSKPTYLLLAERAGYNPAAVRPPQFTGEAFRVQIPGLAEGVTAPVFESEVPSSKMAKGDDSKQIAHCLSLVRDAIEADSLAFSTRTGGTQSILVRYLVPFKNKVRQTEVSYDPRQGYTVAYPGTGTESQPVEDVDAVVTMVKNLIAD